MAQNIFCFRGPAALVAGTASMLFLAGCVGDVPHNGGWSAAAHNKVVKQAYGIMDVPSLAPVPVAIAGVKPAAVPPKPKALPAASRRQSKRRP